MRMIGLLVCLMAAPALAKDMVPIKRGIYANKEVGGCAEAAANGHFLYDGQSFKTPLVKCEDETISALNDKRFQWKATCVFDSQGGFVPETLMQTIQVIDETNIHITTEQGEFDFVYCNTDGLPEALRNKAEAVE